MNPPGLRHVANQFFVFSKTGCGSGIPGTYSTEGFSEFSFELSTLGIPGALDHGDSVG